MELLGLEEKIQTASFQTLMAVSIPAERITEPAQPNTFFRMDGNNFIRSIPCEQKHKLIKSRICDW